MAVGKLSRTLAHYPWGGQGAISELFGWSPTDEPEAEWWLGVHPVRPSTLAADKTPLSEWLQRYDARSDLPYLFKVLAPTMPLSLQVHPTTEQAERGYDAETSAGVALDAPERLYKDRFAKPELVVALDGGFVALAGVRPLAESIDALRALGADGQTPAIDSFIDRLQSSGIPATVEWVLGGGDEVTQLVEQLAGQASRNDTLSRLVTHFPADPGIAIAMLLHRADLEPGQALFVDAGVPHAYLEGYAVELMAPSDNVLRGGLTSKHIDTEAFVDIASLKPGPVPMLAPESANQALSVYYPPGQAFDLSRLQGSQVSEKIELSGPSIVLCTEGTWQLRGPRGSVTASRGEAWVVSQSESPMVFEGSGQLWWASPR